ncbi:Os01g0334600 [Oryza sativa Japonica Group]|uniref:Os01g0334600 protein n=1 Tax=Oryza sativa subsp. japonica TaxID=39947 RepID=A0A0P0V2C0_ORYSJ|nr:Os01g0334600 [Oryza sativa Japonica Group]
MLRRATVRDMTGQCPEQREVLVVAVASLMNHELAVPEREKWTSLEPPQEEESSLWSVAAAWSRTRSRSGRRSSSLPVITSAHPSSFPP